MTDDLFPDLPDRESYEQPTHVARQGLSELALRVLRSIGGDEAVTQRPIVPTLTAEMMQTVAADPAQGIDVLVKLRQEVSLQIGWWLSDARGVGLSWAELAAPLGAPLNPYGDTPAAQLAWNRYRELVDTHEARNNLLFWGCQSCRQQIADFGPLQDNPEQDERGHAADCARHQRDINAWLDGQHRADLTPTDPTVT